MKKIIGLDLGTNSIGWARIEMDENDNCIKDIKLGSRIIPMTQDVLSSFDKGETVSQTALRTEFRGKRRLLERHLQRRERLFKVLHTLGFLPPHFDAAIGWDAAEPSSFGKFLDHSEPKLAWERQEDGTMRFLFMESFHEMLADFAQHQPSLVADGKRIPLDWTLYYLRKKALTQPITKEELAWIILSFNQKRGYNQLRGEEEEEDITKRKEYHELKVVSVEATDRTKGDNRWYNIHLENGWIYPRQSKQPLNEWVGKTRAFIVTTEYEADGITPKKDSEGNVKRNFSSPKEDDWVLIKKRTEHLIDATGKTLGTYIYDHLLTDPAEKVRGKLVRTVERKYYRMELEAILREQAKHHAEFSSPEMLAACAKILYPSNVAHQQSLQAQSLIYLIMNDIIFYQRPLKSKKSLIDNCPYEAYTFVNKDTGEIKQQPIKCIAKSNPYYQEFRLWQFIANLRFYDRRTDADVTSRYLSSPEDYTRLFQFLNDLKEIGQEGLMRNFLKLKKVNLGTEKGYEIRWNYIEDKAKKYPCNSTRHELLTALERAGKPKEWLDDKGMEYRLWHLLYSVENKNETEGALRKIVDDDVFVNAFLKVKPFKKEYGAYSEKATKKLLALMRMGAYWSEDNICPSTLERINLIIAGEVDSNLQKRMRLEQRSFTRVSDFQGLPTWLACYVVYGRHSETTDLERWRTPDDLMRFINSFKQHSLRNPIVEQCILETLRTVHDLWKKEGQIDEFHIELARNMKGTAEQRKRMTDAILSNENTNLRIKHLLIELKNDPNISGVRPFSPSQQEKMRIYEEGALATLTDNDKEIEKISKMAEPSQKELQRYKLWLEQKYRSPYTGQQISLTKLFTDAYQIEHVIPQSRFFDDSFSNKVICEAEVNKLKDRLLGLEFIKTHGGEMVHSSALGPVRILTEGEYKLLVDNCFRNNRTKKLKMLLEDIPQDFINRQLNDSRYISKVIKGLLSKIVRQPDELEATSKQVIVCTGDITNRLKEDWGLNDVWNDLMAPRYQRLNDLTATNNFGHWEDKNGKRVFQTTVPLELQRGFSKKRIDHRHHALDALVIACASRNIVSYLNNVSAATPQQRFDLKRLLCNDKRQIKKPWDSFTQDAKAALEDIVVTFKNYVRVINKASNYYERYDKNGKRVREPQKGQTMWAIRKPMHKDTVFGHVNLRRKDCVKLKVALERVKDICDKDLRNYILALIAKGFNTKQLMAHFKSISYKLNGQKIDKVEIWRYTDETKPMVATRKALDTSFDKAKVLSITDTGIQKILLNYLAAKANDPALAFSPEGIEEMNAEIALYNDGKPHQPIYKVRITEPMGAKYAVGKTGSKTKKFVEAAKGTNLFFAIYEDEEGQRAFDTVPLNEVAERLKEGLSPVPETNENGLNLKFYLSPNDLVYVPDEEERANGVCNMDKERIYKMVKASGYQCFFIASRVANSIVDKMEFSTANTMEKSITGEMIKAICWKIEVDRLGNILQIMK